MSDKQKVSVTLYGEDAEWFEDLKQEIAKQRNGHEPQNFEVARMMMAQFDPESRGVVMSPASEYKTVEVTLYDKSSETFRELKAQVDDLRRGRMPSNSEPIRIMMDHFDPARRV